jgi:hypothetical protein
MQHRFPAGAQLVALACAAVLALLASGDPAMAQVTANGTTVDLTPAQAVCNSATTCFLAENAGTINSAGNAVNVTTTGGNAYGASAQSGGAIHLDDGGTITTSGGVAFGLYAANAGSTITSNVDIMTTGGLAYGAAATGGLITLNGGPSPPPTTMRVA